MCSSRFSLHKSVYLKSFWTRLENVHLQGPCRLRPCSSRPYCTNIMTSVLQQPLKIFSPGNILFNAATCPDRKNLRLFYCCDSLIYSIVFLTKYGNLSRLYSLSSHQDAALALSTIHNGPCDLKMVS